MPLINCEINLILTCSINCLISNVAANKKATFAITHTKLYVPVVTLSTLKYVKLLQQLKSGFADISNNQKKPQDEPNQYLDYLIDPCLQRANRLFVLAFNANVNKIGHLR